MDNITKNIILTPFNLLYKISPKKTLELLFRLKVGHKLDLDNPKTYNEKLQWIKLYDKNELMTKCCDKYTVREYIESCGYSESLNDLYWQGYDPEDIPFDSLPNKFVIKVTHGSSFNIICNDKRKLDRRGTIKKLNKWLKAKFIPCYGEWFYGVEKPRVIVEKYLENEDDSPLFDYKFFCFNGEPKLIYIDTWRDNEHHINAYDTEFNLLPSVKLGFENDLIINIKKPENLDMMLDYARNLSKPFLHVRVDLYNVNNNIVFGELTFTKGAGFSKIEPHSFDVTMGSWLELPPKQEVVG